MPTVETHFSDMNYWAYLLHVLHSIWIKDLFICFWWVRMFISINWQFQTCKYINGEIISHEFHTTKKSLQIFFNKNLIMKFFSNAPCACNFCLIFDTRLMKIIHIGSNIRSSFSILCAANYSYPLMLRLMCAFQTHFPSKIIEMNLSKLFSKCAAIKKKKVQSDLKLTFIEWDEKVNFFC